MPYNENHLTPVSFSVYFVPMDTVKRAAQILQRAEASLRGLVSEAARFGDYGSVVQIASWARTVNDLVRATPRRRERRQLGPPVTPEIQKRGKGTAPILRRTSRPAAQATYPRFLRRGDHLVRVAWSKREKKEYQHKTPHAALRALTAAIVEKGADGRVFSTDQILPIHDGDGSEVPSYQAYVGLALLKQTGLIDQHGRQGYSIPRLAEFRDAVEAVWRKLPEP